MPRHATKSKRSKSRKNKRSGSKIKTAKKASKMSRKSRSKSARKSIKKKRSNKKSSRRSSRSQCRNSSGRYISCNATSPTIPGYYHKVRVGGIAQRQPPVVPLAPERDDVASAGYIPGKLETCSSFDEASCKRRPRCSWDYTKNQCHSIKGSREAALKLGLHKPAWAAPEPRSVCGGQLSQFDCNNTMGCQWRDQDQLCVSKINRS